MVEVFREVRRVLRPDGVLFLNIGDSYAGSWGAQGRQGESGQVASRSACAERQIAAAAKRVGRTGALDKAPGLKNKDLMMVPARVALALQSDGWWLRSKITWAKAVSFRPDFCGTCTPESATDRPTNSSEEIFLMTKRATYFYDNEAVKEQGSIAPGTLAAKGSEDRASEDGVNGRPPTYWEYSGLRNLRSVWAINPRPFKEAHYATFPPELPDVCIRAGTSEKGACQSCGAPVVRIVKTTRSFESGSGRSGNAPVGKNGEDMQGGGETGDVSRGPVLQTETIGWKASCKCKDADRRPCIVLDPFMGSGTTGLVAAKLSRSFLGIELNPANVEMAERRAAAELAQAKLF